MKVRNATQAENIGSFVSSEIEPFALAKAKELATSLDEATKELDAQPLRMNDTISLSYQVRALTKAVRALIEAQRPYYDKEESK